MKLTTKMKQRLHIVIPIAIALLSVFLMAAKVPQMGFMTETIASLEKSKTTVMEFTGATLATSVAISALPDDFATPLADSLADMSKYFILIMVVLFVERLIVVEGIRLSFLLLIPIACGLYVLAYCIKNNFIKSLSYKLSILALAIVLVVPISTHITELVGADYLDYVDETISETHSGADKINDIMAQKDEQEDATIFEKLSTAFKTAIQGVTDLLDYFKNVVKKCMTSIAILVVTTFVMPVLTFLFFKWLWKELFNLNASFVHMKSLFPMQDSVKEAP